jgi:Asp-tRNA(Asn)/Glu-tRNA(Gln) amidotransferase A subunit family amidase
VAAQNALTEARARFAELIAGFDVLLTPVAASAAPEGLLATGDPLFNTAWTALGVPALSIPAFRDKTGMPVGLQVVAAYRDDARMLAAARAIAAEFDVAVVRPVE